MKNSFLLFILLLVCSLAEAQTSIKFILTANMKVDSVSIMDISQQENYKIPYQDTLTFNFKKDNLDCYNLRYFVGSKMYWKQVWLNAGNTTVKAHLMDTAHMTVDTVVNSPIYYSVMNYLKMGKVLDSDTAGRNNFMLDQIRHYLETPRSIAIATDYVNFNQNSRINLLKLKALLGSQKTDFSWFLFYYGITRLDKLLEVRSLNLSAFQFINKTSKITKIKLKENYLYILDFWYVGCVPCMQQHKELKAKLQELTNHKVQVIGISIDKDPKPWKKYLINNDYRWDNFLQTDTNKLSDYLGVQAFPAYLILNSKGVVQSSFLSLHDALGSLNIN